MTSITRKTTNNTSNIQAATATISQSATVASLYVTDISMSGTMTQIADLEEEPHTAISGTTSPFTCDYSTGNTFYIPTDYEPAANYNIIITNIPTDTSRTYFITVVNRQATGMYYADGVRVSDTTTGYTFSGASGTNDASNFCIPYLNGGAPVIAATPNIIVQQFAVVSVATSGGSFTRYITSSISNFY